MAAIDCKHTQKHFFHILVQAKKLRLLLTKPMKFQHLGVSNEQSTQSKYNYSV